MSNKTLFHRNKYEHESRLEYDKNKHDNYELEAEHNKLKKMKQDLDSKMLSIPGIIERKKFMKKYMNVYNKLNGSVEDLNNLKQLGDSLINDVEDVLHDLDIYLESIY